MSYLGAVTHVTDPMTALRALHPLNHLRVHTRTLRTDTCNPFYSMFSPSCPIINTNFEKQIVIC